MYQSLAFSDAMRGRRNRKQAGQVVGLRAAVAEDPVRGAAPLAMSLYWAAITSVWTVAWAGGFRGIGDISLVEVDVQECSCGPARWLT